MDVNIRLLSAEAGKARTFELWDGMKKLAAVSTSRPMTKDEMLALFRPPDRPKKRSKKTA